MPKLFSVEEIDQISILMKLMFFITKRRNKEYHCFNCCQNKDQVLLCPNYNQSFQEYYLHTIITGKTWIEKYFQKNNTIINTTNTIIQLRLIFTDDIEMKIKLSGVKIAWGGKPPKYHQLWFYFVNVT